MPVISSTSTSYRWDNWFCCFFELIMLKLLDKLIELSGATLIYYPLLPHVRGLAYCPDTTIPARALKIPAIQRGSRRKQWLIVLPKGRKYSEFIICSCCGRHSLECFYATFYLLFIFLDCRLVIISLNKEIIM